MYQLEILLIGLYVKKSLSFDILSFKNIFVHLENVIVLFDFYFWIVIIIYLLGTGAQPTIVE